jgi:hypothetical protein
MALPETYTRTTSFTEAQAEAPDVPQSGVDLDREFDNAGSILNELRSNLAKIQRDDDKLRNGVVHFYSLSQEVLDFITANGGSGVFVPAVGDDGEALPDTGSGGSTGGSGAVYFRQLLDTPNSFTGAAGKILRVNDLETGFVYDDETSVEVKFNDLTDTPEISEANAGLFARSNGTVIEFAALPIDPDGAYARLDEENDWTGQSQKNLHLNNYSEQIVDLGTASGTIELDAQAGNMFRLNANGNCLWNIVNKEADKGFSFTVRLTSTGTNGHTWFSGIDWGDHGEPVLESGKTAVLSFVAWDEGSVDGFITRYVAPAVE